MTQSLTLREALNIESRAAANPQETLKVHRTMRYRFGDATVDRRTGVLTRTGRAVPIEPRAFDVLWVLIEHSGELVEHQTLIDRVWDGVFVTPHSLTEAISQLRRVLDDDSRRPRIIETAYRRGYRFVAPLERIADEDGTRWRMPARLVALIGREADLVGLNDRLATSRLITIVGPGGVGKTQLALEAARGIEASFADGARLVDLAPASGEGDVARLIGAALGIPERHDDDLAISIASLLRDTKALLLLDNCERVSAAAGRLAELMLAAAPGIQVLATSQRALGAAGEVLVRLAPLSYVALNGSDRLSPAVRLFEIRATAVQPGFDVSGRHAATVQRICERLDGLPLAIELAATQIRVLNPAQILERLDSRLDLFARAAPALPARHRTLGAVLEWSASLLEPLEERLLEHVAVFPAAWDIELAAVVMGCPSDSTELLTALTGLVDKSLVFVEIADRSATYRLLDSVRLFALDRLRGAGRDALAYDRLLEHYVALAERAHRDWYTASAEHWLERLNEELANIRIVLQWALAPSGRADLGLRLAGSLRWFWRAGGHFLEGFSYLQRALDRPSDSVFRARAEIALGQLAHHRLDFELASRMFIRGLERLGAAPSIDVADALAMTALNEALLDRPVECARAAKAALDIADAAGVDWISASAGLALGLMHAMCHQHQAAVREMAQAYDRAVRSHDSFLESYVATNLALQRFLAGDPAGSRELFVRALSLSRGLRNVRAVAGCFEGLGYLASADGNPALGARLTGAAARIRDITTGLLPQWKSPHEEHHQLVDDALGSDAAARERAAGAATPIDELVALLLP